MAQQQQANNTKQLLQQVVEQLALQTEQLKHINRCAAADSSQSCLSALLLLAVAAVGQVGACA
jgi:hypothetical protein